MPERPGYNPETKAEIKKSATETRRRFLIWDRRLRNVDDVAAQTEWQDSGTSAERSARALFDVLGVRKKDAPPVAPVVLGLPETDALVAELAKAVIDPNYAPGDGWA